MGHSLMTAKDPTAKERKTREREQKRSLGLRPMEIWAHPDDQPQIKALAWELNRLRLKKAAQAT